MSKLVMLSGLPASGKSTRAHEIMKASGNMIRLNKDLIRMMLHFDKFTGRNEGTTVDAEIALARHFLTHNTGVIVDDTNLGEKHKARWKTLSKECNAGFEQIWMPTGMAECLIRDASRVQGRVGADVIKRLALQYGLAPIPTLGYVLCDIDGTLADLTHRLHFVHTDGRPNDWPSFFKAAEFDTPRHEIIQQVRSLTLEGHDIVFVSGRPEEYKDITIRWLAEHVGVEEYYLLMRRAHDRRDDDIVKEEILNTYFPDRSRIKLVIDDRPRVIRMWQKYGLKVEDVGKGIEF